MNLKKFKQKIILAVLPPLAWLMIWLLYLSCRNRFHLYEGLKESNFISSFWHGDFLMLPFAYIKSKNKPKICVISSNHFDGELMVKLYRFFGFHTIRGSTNKGGARVLVESFRRLKDGWDMGITPDGPRGPYHHIADGVVAMAQKTGVGISVTKPVFSSYYELSTWDKFKIPKPFSTIDYYMLEPFFIPKDMDMEEAKKLVYERMEESL
ncbi:lysophospholipid acyltransferase family protein [Helicobacter cappadocius]|uniref:Lysophospholipid acyltransferase family protein n=1 Tax=Helicobacter cappadocius TaxID=3063998 RepID=A0AA90PPE5_9HELI|nr:MULTISPECIES: lysophospholipid acyltransferase family protein [unclassified Helicobacter]MDO7252314.1 lysophospholipid acyltransferase family protein [Helicobacter sp. faydin-H75]MDP2538181.1 lysophospholipid acyltransferase family protein [Helicobacter sp. faydin-H76]